MGYTVTVQAKTRELGDKMIAFMREHSKSAVLLFTGKEGNRHFSDLVWADSERGLSYCDRKDHLGYDYNCGGLDRAYLYALIRWIATKIAKDKPRYLYDDGVWVDVNPGEYITEEEKDVFLFFSPFADFSKEKNNVIKDTLSEIILEEIKRLNELWGTVQSSTATDEHD